MKVSIFGASGFVGEYIVKELVENNHKPLIINQLGQS